MTSDILIRLLYGLDENASEEELMLHLLADLAEGNVSAGEEQIYKRLGIDPNSTEEERDAIIRHEARKVVREIKALSSKPCFTGDLLLLNSMPDVRPAKADDTDLESLKNRVAALCRRASGAGDLRLLNSMADAPSTQQDEADADMRRRLGISKEAWDEQNQPEDTGDEADMRRRLGISKKDWDKHNKAL